jgi:hypothetical protein
MTRPVRRCETCRWYGTNVSKKPCSQCWKFKALPKWEPKRR